MSFNKLARFYDLAIGDRTRTADYIHRLIVYSKPDAKTLLELACGTGAILKILAQFYEVTGLDISPQMLSIARRKLPRVRFFRQDMVKFDLGKKFDVIICVFDSINHVLKFSDWKKIFARAAQHLEQGGLFLFDINTEAKLERLIRAPIWVTKFGRNFELIKVTDARKRVANWNIKVLEHQTRDRYKLFEENVKQISFPVNQIRQSLRQQFHEVRVIDAETRKLSSHSNRLYFVCKK